MEELIRHHMETLGITREEAISLIREDEEIDGGAKLFELTAEQKQNAKSVTSTTSGKKTERKPKEKKVDETKRSLIEIVRSALFENEIYCEVTNVEKTIDFNLNGEQYSLNLTKHRPKK